MKHSKEFRSWQHKFYTSREWIETRNAFRESKRFICDSCNKLIKGKSVVHHVKEITPGNKDDWNITLNPNNLELLCFNCHNELHFGEKYNFDLTRRKDVNLF